MNVAEHSNVESPDQVPISCDLHGINLLYVSTFSWFFT